MFKPLLVFLLCFGITPFKSITDSSKVRIGLKAALGGSGVSGVQAYMDRGFSNYPVTAGLLGFSVNRKLNAYFSFGAELLLGFRGGRFSKEKDSLAVSVYWVQNGKPVYDTALSYDQNHKFTTIDFPLYFKASFDWRKISPFITGGIVPSYVLYYRYEWNGWDDNNHIYELDRDLTAYTNRFAAGLMASIGCRNRWWSAEVRYNYFNRCDIMAYGKKFSPSNQSLLLVLTADISLK